MEAPTPTFCQDLMSKNLKKKCNFSKACKRMAKNSYSNLNLNKLDDKNQKEKSKIKKAHNKRHQSQKFKLKQYDDIEDINEEEIRTRSKSKSITKKKRNKEIFNNIKDFIKYHKFKLRNDFDRKHSEQFLSSKEEAFEKPFLLTEELCEEKNRNFNFTLKND